MPPALIHALSNVFNKLVTQCDNLLRQSLFVNVFGRDDPRVDIDIVNHAALPQFSVLECSECVSLSRGKCKRSVINNALSGVILSKRCSG